AHVVAPLLAGGGVAPPFPRTRNHPNPYTVDYLPRHGAANRRALSGSHVSPHRHVRSLAARMAPAPPHQPARPVAGREHLDAASQLPGNRSGEAKPRHGAEPGGTTGGAAARPEHTADRGGLCAGVQRTPAERSVSRRRASGGGTG